MLAASVLLGVLSALPSPAAQARPERETAARTVVLDGVHVHLHSATGQVVTVQHSRGHHARVTLYRKNRHGWYQQLRAADGRIGYGGLVPGPRRRQGTGTTPLGTYRLTYAFGTQEPRDSWDVRYRRIEPGDYWVQDNSSRYYNRYRNKRQGGFRWWLPKSHPDSSERLLDFKVEYELAVLIDFNHAQVRHRGAGIFLHVNGDGATAGCVSVPRPFMRRLMGMLRPDEQPVIAVGR
jgi:L,D-peptidoglycan transpeptidase YkuD (ErfK/YbiS/YcfS/YnhG family)